MDLYIVLLIYIAVLISSNLFFTKYLRKNLFFSFLAALIIGQITLIIISCFGLFDQGSGHASTSTELIFWSINLMTPFLIYGGLLYIIITRKL